MHGEVVVKMSTGSRSPRHDHQRWRSYQFLLWFQDINQEPRVVQTMATSLAAAETMSW